MAGVSFLVLLLAILRGQVFCELNCQTSNWDTELLECFREGEKGNNILASGRSTDAVFNVPTEYFERFDWTSIKTFRIRNAKLLNISPQLFKSAGNLVNLDLSGNPELCFIGNEFSNLKNLKTLRLSGTGRCPGNELLSTVTQLHSLDLSDLRVPSNFFSLRNLNAFTDLEIVDLSRNYNVDLTKFTIGRAVVSLNASNTAVVLGNNCFQVATKLTTVTMSHSNINNIPKDTFKGTQIRDLDLSYNNLRVIDLDSLTSTMNIVNLSHNLIGDFVKPGILKQGIRRLDLSYNNITFIHVQSFWLPENLEYLSLSHNQLGWIFEKIFEGIGTLKELDLSYNMFATFYDTVFGDLVNLETLNLAGNLQRQLDNGLLQNNIKLKHLYLQDNELETLNILTFVNLKQLKTLDLRRNKLKRLPEDLFHIGNINNLAISCNRLSYLTSGFFKGKLGTKVTLQGNPWKCACLNPIVNALDVYELRIDSQYFNEGSHPTCYIGNTLSGSCDDNTLTEGDYLAWEQAVKLTGIKC